jgi:hypothetical protein
MTAKSRPIIQMHDMCITTAAVKVPLITKTSATTFSVAAGGVARFVDDYTNPLRPVAFDVSIPAQTDVTAILVGTGLPATFLKMDKDKNVTQDFQGSIPSDRNRKVVYGYLEHLDSSQIENYGGITQSNSNANLAGALSYGLASIKISTGDVILPYSTNMQIKVGAGQVVAGGVNIVNSYDEQNYNNWAAIPLVSNILYTFGLSGGGFGFHSSSTIVANKWDDGTATDWASLPTVPSTNWTIQRGFIIADPRTHTAKVVIQLGQFVHANFDDALGHLPAEQFIRNPQSYLGYHLTDIALRGGATDLSLGLGSLPSPDALFLQRQGVQSGY